MEMSTPFESSIGKNLGESQSTLEKLLSWDAEYEALDQFLNSVTKKTHSSTHVQLGKLAFAEGDLIHTNEVTVSLGDNWFVERSASQAKDIVRRRKEYLGKEIEGVRAQIKNLEAKSTLYAEAGVKGGGEEEAGYVEIREEVGVDDTDFSAIQETTRRRPIAPKKLGEFERKMMEKLRKYEQEEEEGAGDVDEDEGDTGEESDEYEKGLRDFGSGHKEDDDEDDFNASEFSNSDGASSTDDEEDIKPKPPPLRSAIRNSAAPLRPAIRSPADIYERMRGRSVKDSGKAAGEGHQNRLIKPAPSIGGIVRDVVERDVEEADASDFDDYVFGKEIAEEYVNSRNKLLLRDGAFPKDSSDEEDSDDDKREFRHLRSGAASRTVKTVAEAIVDDNVQGPVEKVVEKLVEKPAEKKISRFKERRLQK